MTVTQGIQQQDIPSDTIPPRRPHLLIFPKQFYPLGTNHSNRSAYGGYFHSDQHSVCIHLFCFYSKTATFANRKLSPTITRAHFWILDDNHFLSMPQSSIIALTSVPASPHFIRRQVCCPYSQEAVSSLIMLLCVFENLFLSGLANSHFLDWAWESLSL